MSRGAVRAAHVGSAPRTDQARITPFADLDINLETRAGVRFIPTLPLLFGGRSYSRCLSSGRRHACGVVIDPGLILTPYHVIEGATKIYVHLPDRGGSYADIHAADSRSDLAVLKLITPPPGMVPIPFGEVRLRDQGNKPVTITPGRSHSADR